MIRILRCETYTGVWHYNKFESYAPATGQRREYRRLSKYKLRPRPREEWIRVQLHDPLHLIDREQWRRVQTQLTRNVSFSERNSRHAYLLRGLVVCGGCKARYVGDPNHGKFYYRCHRRCKRYPAVREELLDEAVWEAVEEVILNPDIILEQIEKQEQKTTAKAATAESERKEVEQGIEKVDEEERRILEAYRLSVLTPAILGQELAHLNARRSSLLQRKTELDAQNRQPDMPAIRRTVQNYCRETAQRLSALTPAERQRLLQLLIDAIIFKGDEITIRGVIPPGNDSAQQSVELETPHAQAVFSSAGGIATMESLGCGHPLEINVIVNKRLLAEEVQRDGIFFNIPRKLLS